MGEETNGVASVKAGILGSGNIGTDLMYKLLKRPGHMEVTMLAGIDPDSDGLKRARSEGVETSHHGVDAIAEDPDIKIVFDATSARAHFHAAEALEGSGKLLVDMTPSHLGPFVVPPVNLTEHLDATDVTAQNAKIAVLLVPGIGTSRELRQAAEVGIGVVRIAVHCTEADVSEQHFEVASELGLETVGFLMMSHSQPPGKLAEQAKLMDFYGADCVYVVDSAGALLPSGARERVVALKDAVSCQVGFHAHNNLGSAIGNTVAAIEEGVDQVDGTLRGLGAGAGNAPTEVLVAVLDKMGYETGIDTFALLDAAEYTVAPMMPFQPIPDRDSIASGYAGVYASFLLHARHAAEHYGIDMNHLFAELGRRQAIAGQEDWILEVAAELAASKSAVRT